MRDDTKDHTEPDDGGTFDPSRLRLSQDFVASAGTKKTLITVPVRKPHRQEWIRVRSGADWHLDTAVIELKEEGETYLLAADLRSELSTEMVAKTIFVAINRQGVVFLWTVRLPDAEGKIDEWNRSARIGAQRAMTTWVRVASNRSLGAYEIFEASAADDPEWPDVSLQELLRIAFRDRLIDTVDHPVIRRLRGYI